MSFFPSPLGSTVSVRGIPVNRLGRSICMLMSERSDWQGTSTELLDALRQLYPNDRRLAAQTPNGLGQHLSKLRHTLVRAGLVEIETARVGHHRTRMIYLTTLDQQACADAAKPVGSSADNADKARAEFAGVDHALALAIASVVPMRRT